MSHRTLTIFLAPLREREPFMRSRHFCDIAYDGQSFRARRIRSVLSATINECFRDENPNKRESDIEESQCIRHDDQEV